MSLCAASSDMEHSFVKVSRSHETIVAWGFVSHPILHHTAEVMVCSKCGKVVDPWKEYPPD